MRLLLILFLSLFLCACAPVKMPTINNYAIADISPVKMKKAREHGLSILVSEPVSDPGYQTSAMIYTYTPYELEAYSRNRWVAPPAKMLTPIFVSRLKQTGYFHVVIAPPFAGNTDLNLQTRLVKLQQEFLTPMSRVQLTLDAVLIDNRRSRVIATKEFNVSVPAPANNPYSGVLATNKAVSTLSHALVQFCLQSLRS